MPDFFIQRGRQKEREGGEEEEERMKDKKWKLHDDVINF